MKSLVLNPVATVVVGPGFFYLHGGDALWLVLIWVVGLNLLGAVVLVWILAKIFGRKANRDSDEQNK